MIARSTLSAKRYVRLVLPELTALDRGTLPAEALNRGTGRLRHLAQKCSRCSRRRPVRAIFAI